MTYFLAPKLLAALVALCAAGEQYDCTPLIRSVSAFDPTLASLISVENPITVRLSDRVFTLEFQFEQTLGLLALEPKSRCIQQNREVVRAMNRYFVDRLTFLLDRGSRERFFTEYDNLRAPRMSQRALESLHENLASLESRYMEAVHAALLDELEGTPWSGYRGIPLRLETWTEEWRPLLGRDAPAAVRLDTSEVALRPFEYSRAELRVFLFHEIAHLADPTRRTGVRGPSCGEENEIHAWRETMAYLDSLEARGARIPPLFEAVRSNIRLYGVTAWSRMVIASREND